MTAFVVLAAGRGSRMGRAGEGLHKALVPLNGRAAISHLFELAPPGARLVVCVGYRADQVKRYVRLAHPQRRVEFVDVPDWDKPGSGPGASLLHARATVGDNDVAFTSVDTLWQPDASLWKTDTSWVGVAPVPAGTNPTRWCRFRTQPNGEVDEVLDKRAGDGDDAYVGLAYVRQEDLGLFWEGVENSELRAGERQVSGGFTALVDWCDDGLRTRRIHWTDVGDEEAYRLAVAKFSGYDWTKTGQATYVLPSEGRVVKWMADAGAVARRAERGWLLNGVVAQPIKHDVDMLAYPYLPGVSAYADAERNGVFTATLILDWFHKNIWSTRDVSTAKLMRSDANEFYREKTLDRIEKLGPGTRWVALDAVYRIHWDALAAGVVPGLFHGDLNYGNVVISPEGDVKGIDWREDFNGRTYGDLRYDLAKLLAGTQVNWDWAQRGDFRPWPQGDEHRRVISEFIFHRLTDVELRDVEIIGALSLVNSAPLHAPPLDEVLVARGVDWLNEVL